MLIFSHFVICGNCFYFIFILFKFSLIVTKDFSLFLTEDNAFIFVNCGNYLTTVILVILSFFYTVGYVSYVNCILCFFNPCPLWTILSIGVNVLIFYRSVFMSVFSTIQPSFSLLHNVIFIHLKVYLMDSLQG